MSLGRAAAVVALVLLHGCSSRSEDHDRTTGERAPTEPGPGALPPPSSNAGDGGAEDEAPAPAKRIHTLIIGNSQIFFWDLPRLLSVLSESGAPEAPRIDAEGFTKEAANLEYLWEAEDSKGRRLETVLRDGHYDVVVIAESIDLVELAPPKARFVTYASRMIEAARASGARPVLYATPYPDHGSDRWGFAEMAAPQVELGRAMSVPVAAGGLAWLRVWKELPSIYLHHTDHAHPGFKGSVISAMVLYSVITGAAPTELTTAPAVQCDGAPCPAISEAEGDVFRRAAWDEARATGLE